MIIFYDYNYSSIGTYNFKNKYTQENPTHPTASPSMSPRIEGYEFPAGK